MRHIDPILSILAQHQINIGSTSRLLSFPHLLIIKAAPYDAMAILKNKYICSMAYWT